MQRAKTSNTRLANAAEKQFAGWIKYRPCCGCGRPGPSIVHHAEGQTFRHNKVLVGHWFLLPLCPKCDSVVTDGSRKKFREEFGPQSVLWEEEVRKSPYKPPSDVREAIMDWGR